MGPSTGLNDPGGQRLAAPPIRGRAGELKVIGALVTALAQGHGGVLVIEGPPGIGKSRLLTEGMALAAKSGARTLFGEAFEYQQTVPFFALFMATLRADPPVGDADALRRLGGSEDLPHWVVHDLADAIPGAAVARQPAPRRAGAVGADHPHRGRRARGPRELVGAATRGCHLLASGRHA